MRRTKMCAGMLGLLIMMLLFGVSVHAACAHSYGNWKVQSKATVAKNGKLARVCENCGYIQTKSVKWTYAGSQNKDDNVSQRYKSYGLTVYSVCAGDKYVLIEAEDSQMEIGAVIKLTVGKKKYSYTMKSKSKNWLYKIPVTNPKAYEKITATMYYKGKKIGVDQYHMGEKVSKELNYPTVLCGKKPVKGMTKKQVQNTYAIYGEKIQIQSKAKGGYEYGRTKRYNFVFKNGKLESFIKR